MQIEDTQKEVTVYWFKFPRAQVSRCLIIDHQDALTRGSELHYFRINLRSSYQDKKKNRVFFSTIRMTFPFMARHNFFT